MKKVYKRSLTSKLYMLFGICWVWFSMSSCLINYYSPSTDISFAGTTSYCQGAAATPNTYTYDQCTTFSGIIDQGVNMTVQWYYNTTGGTVIGTSTPLGGPTSVTSPAGGTGTLNYTPLTTTTGTFYYFAYMSWSAAGSCTSDYTSGTQTINITAPPATITGPASVCVGSTITLSTTATGGAWSSSAPGTASVVGGVVTGVAAGTVTIYYTIGGCAASKVITVLAAPTAITPSTPLVFCQGTTTALGSTPGSGTWTSSNPAVGTVSTSGVVNGVGGGTTTITYTLASGCYQTKTVTVSPNPGPIGGTPIACPGYTMTLTNPAAGGTWSSVTPSVATINSLTGVVTGVTPGTTLISYTGCNTVTIVVTVNNLPAAIAGPASVCEGGATVVMSDVTPGGTWSSSTPALATAFTAGSGLGIITGIAAGTVVITYMAPTTCIATKTLTVAPLPAAITGIVPICVGNTMTLANAAGDGSWSSSVPGVATADPFTGIITGVAGGTTLISYTNACGTGTATVTIDALPAPITGRDTVCIGAYTTLANVTIGGTWSSSNPAVASVLPGSGLITGNAVGTTYISYIMPGGCYVTDLLTSYLMPSAVSGSTQVCPGTTTVLANSIPGGTWSSNNPVAATIGATSGLVTGQSADTVGMVYTTPSGCTAYALVTVNPLPLPISGDLVFCAADVDTLTDLSPGGSWSSLTPSVATIDAVTGIVTAVGGGTATIRYTLPTGCAITKSFTVNPAPSPVVTFNNAINTFYTTLGFSSYQWYNSVQGLIPGATTYRTAGTIAADYYVVVTDEKGCRAESAHYPYTLSMGVGSAPAVIDAHIYPNPSTDMVYIECAIPVKAVINSMDGKLLIQKENAKEISIAMLAPGVYTLSLADAQGQVIMVSKLVKE